MLLVITGTILVISGTLAILLPRAIAVGHQAQWLGIFRIGSGGTVEIVSENGCIVYGIFAYCMGAGALWNATIQRPEVQKEDRSVAQAILEVRRALDERYGRLDGCSQRQIEMTAQALGFSQEMIPYLLAAFLGRTELGSLRETLPGIDWAAVEEKIDRISFDLPYGDLNGAHFHESWRAGNEA
jgi:hypothetical protein